MAKRKKTSRKKQTRPAPRKKRKSAALPKARETLKIANAIIQVGTAQQSIARAVRLYEADLSKLYIRKRKAKTKSARGKLTRKMREVERKLNRLK